MFKKISYLIPILINFGALVWFAASVNAKLEALQSTQAQQTLILTDLVHRISQHDIDIAVLKYQLDNGKKP